MAAKKGRSAGFIMSDSHRVKIQNSNVLNALLEHVDGKREMSASQVTAGVALLKKYMPDLASHTIGGDKDAAPIHFENVGASKLMTLLDAIAERS